MRFVGKEKDRETGLQYFGARYMKNEIGRFLSPDPMGPVDPKTNRTNYKMLENPQLLNRYAYSLNNPYRYMDATGKWPTEVHNTIIKTAFSGSLPKDAIAAIMRGSRNADASKYQDQAHSYMHSMRAEGQSSQEAERLMNDYIKQKVGEYKTLLSQGKTDAAYEALGMAMHPIMDSTSPVHEGFQEWKGWKDPIGSGYHVARESEVFFTQKDLTRTVNKVREFYDLNKKKKTEIDET
jgi:RHS repeat-associated protein